MVEKEETQAKNWAEEVDEDDDDAADQAIGNAEEKTEEVKKEEEADEKECDQVRLRVTVLDPSWYLVYR